MSRRKWGEDSTVNLKLSNGSSITVVFRGNLFDLSLSERKLVDGISELVQTYARDTKEPVP